MTTGAAEAIRRLIRREGPIPFDRFVELALYEPAGGFFALNVCAPHRPPIGL